jgi:hypothetical protein
MNPTLRPGDWLVVESVPLEKIRRGDIVVFRSAGLKEKQPGSENSITLNSELAELPSSRDCLKNALLNPAGAEPRLLVHRVVAVRPEGLITRGDGNPVSDPECLTPGRLIGRVAWGHRRGKRIRLLQGTPGFVFSFLLRFSRRAVRSSSRAAKAPFRPAYRLLRRRGIIGAIWKPRLTVVRFQSPSGSFVKYLHHDRTVAVWWPASGRFQCRRPYDMILKPPLSR